MTKVTTTYSGNIARFFACSYKFGIMLGNGTSAWRTGTFGVLFTHIMKREDHSRRIQEIVDRLSELLEKERAILEVRGARSCPFVTLDLKQLVACSKHREACKILHEELRALASAKIEDQDYSAHYAR